MEVISGHEGPISCLQYSPTSSILASGSWDKNVRINNLYSRQAQTEIFQHSSNITSLAFNMNGSQLATSTLKGEIWFWNIESGDVEAIIDCQRDLQGGRSQDQKISAQKYQSYYNLNIKCEVQ